MAPTGADDEKGDGGANGIGTLNEGSLHVALKDLVSEPGDEFEVPLGRFVIDVVRGDRLIEIQTGAFAAMGNKLDRLLPDYQIHVVHPIAVETYLVRDGHKRRRSPKKGSVYDVFAEFARVPTLIDHPNLTVEVVLIRQDKHQVHDPKARRGRGGWRTADRTLIEVVERIAFEKAGDFCRLVPKALPSPWTTADLASHASIPRPIAQAMAYCLKANELIVAGRRTKVGIEYCGPDA